MCANDTRPTIEEFKAALALVGMKIGLRHFEFKSSLPGEFTPIEASHYDDLDYHQHAAVLSVLGAYNVPPYYYAVRTHADRRGIMIATADLQGLFADGNT